MRGAQPRLQKRSHEKKHPKISPAHPAADVARRAAAGSVVEHAQQVVHDAHVAVYGAGVERVGGLDGHQVGVALHLWGGKGAGEPRSRGTEAEARWRFSGT